MNINLIFILAMLAPLSMHAMERPVENHGQPFAACPGAELAAQPDARHHATVEGAHYCLTDNHGVGLTAKDLALLRRMVPFAIERSEEGLRRFGFPAGGFLIVGGALYSVAAIIIRSNKSWLRHLCFGLGSMFIGTLLSYCCARSTLNDEDVFKAQVARFVQISRNSENQPVVANCQHEQTLIEQRKHRCMMQVRRMAMGRLYVPECHYDQLTNRQNDFKPLQYILSQPESVLNALLDIPVAYRGNRIFVNAIMKFIKDCEDRTY